MTKQQRLVLFISIAASFVAFLDGSVVNVALPAIARELGGGLALQQWVVDAYLLTLGSCILIAGSLSDIFGRKRVLAVGLAGFLLTSLLCAAAPNGMMLVAARALQGVAGALLVPSSLALIISSFSGPAQGRAIGSWTAWTGISFIVGPLLGGLLVDSASWRFVFAINVVPIVVTFVLMQFLSADRAHRPAPVDVPGAFWCMAGLAGTVYALIQQAHYGWSSPLVCVPFGIGLVALGIFVWWERRTPQPMLPLALFRARNFSVGNLATLAVYAGLSVSTFLIIIFVQQVGGYSALQAGLTILPVTILMFLLSPRFGALAGRYGPRLFMSVGPMIAAAGFIAMLRVGTRVDYVQQLLPAILLFGLGLSVTVAPLTAAILGAVEASRAGVASAVNNAVARVAGLVAIAAVGVVAGPEITVAGFHSGVVATAILLFISGCLSAFGITNRVVRP